MSPLYKFAALGVAAMTLAGGGCAAENPEIPAGARMVAEGNKKLTYQAPRDGTIYVYDDDGNRMIYTGAMQRGQTLSIDTKTDDIMIESRRATEWDLDPDHRILLYFDEQPMSQRHPEGRYEGRRGSDYR